MFSNNVIEKRVMAVVKSRIKDAQGEYDEGVIALEEKLEQAKEELADKLVISIVGTGNKS